MAVFIVLVCFFVGGILFFFFLLKSLKLKEKPIQVKLFAYLFIATFLSLYVYYFGKGIMSELTEETSFTVSEYTNTIFDQYDRNSKDGKIDLNTFGPSNKVMEGDYIENNVRYERIAIFSAADIDSNKIVERKEFEKFIQKFDIDQNNLITSHSSLLNKWKGQDWPNEIKNIAKEYPTFSKSQ